MKIIWNGITKENAIISLTLGLCSTLAVTTTVESAYLMGICVTIVLFFSSIVVSLIKKIVPDNVRLPVYILIVGTFVTIFELLLQTYLPNVYDLLGIYLPLIVVNCIVLGRCLSVYSKKGVTYSMLDSFGIGIGYLLTILLVAFCREVLGNGTITLVDQASSLFGTKQIIYLPINDYFPMLFFQTPAGAFFTLGILIGCFRLLKKVKK